MSNRRVILADTNFWIALSFSRHVFHQAAREWFAAQSAPESILFCRSTQQSFLRLLTTEATTRPYDIPPMNNSGAWKMYESLLADRRVAWTAEPRVDELESQWKAFSSRGSVSPKLWMDAYLAALALAGGHGLVTTDKAFSQFKDLRCIVLVPAKADS